MKKNKTLLSLVCIAALAGSVQAAEIQTEAQVQNQNQIRHQYRGGKKVDVNINVQTQTNTLPDTYFKSIDASDVNNAEGDKTIRTKIAGKPFELKLISDTTGVAADYSLVDNDTNTQITPSETVVFNSKTENVPFEVNEPHKNVSVKMDVCVTYDQNGNAIALPMSDCQVQSVPTQLQSELNFQFSAETHGHHGHHYGWNNDSGNGHTYRHRYGQHHQTNTNFNLFFHLANGKIYKKCVTYNNQLNVKFDASIETHGHHGHHYGWNNDSGNGHTYRHRYGQHHQWTQNEFDLSLQIGTQNPNACVQTYYSTDNFAIRPAAFKVINASNDAFTKAGETHSVKIEAVNAKGQVVGYDVSSDNIQVSPAAYHITNPVLIAAMQNELGLAPTDKVDEQVLGTLTLNSLTNDTAAFTYSEAGVIYPKIAEKAGKEYAKVDEADPGITASELYVTPNSTMYDANGKETALVYKPYAFKVEISNEKYPSWQYMDIAKTGQPLEAFTGETIKIVPVNKAGNKIYNYNRNCFATSSNVPVLDGKQLTVTEPVEIDKKIVMSQPANIAINYFFNGKNVTNVTGVPAGTSEIRTIIPTKEMKNGVDIQIDYQMSVDKDVENWEAPVTIDTKEISVKNAAGISGNTVTLNKHTEFRYGNVEVLPVVTNNKYFTNNVVYQYFNGTNWVLNTEHNGTNGGVQVAKSVTPYMSMTAGPINNGIQPLNFRILTTNSFNTKVELSIPEYLWVSPLGKPYMEPTDTGARSYNHPSFEVIYKTNELGSASVLNSNIANPTDKYDIDRNPDVSAPVKLPQILKYSY